MKKIYLTAITALFLIIPVSKIRAQIDPNWEFQKRDYSINGIGIGALNVEPKGASTSDPWYGGFARINMFEMSYYTGTVHYYDSSSKTTSNSVGYSADIGIHMPVSKLSIGRRHHDIRGMIMMPYVNLDFGLMGISNATGMNVNLAPGIAVQLPYCGIQVQMNGTYNFEDKILYPDKANTLDGLLLYPSLHLYFDGLMNLLKVESVQGIGTCWTATDEGHLEFRNGAWYMVTPGESEPCEIDAKIINRLWGIGPRLGFTTPADSRANSFMYGLTASYRAVLDFDFNYMSGKLGAVSPDGSLSQPENYYNIHEVTLGAGLDLSKLYASWDVDFGDKLHKRIMIFRIIGGWKAGFNQAKTMNSSSVPANATYNGNPYKFNDIHSTFINYPYAAFEFYNIGVSCDFLPKKGFDYGAVPRLNFYYIIPVSAMIRGHRNRISKQ